MAYGTSIKRCSRNWLYIVSFARLRRWSEDNWKSTTPAGRWRQRTWRKQGAMNRRKTATSRTTERFVSIENVRRLLRPVFAGAVITTDPQHQAIILRVSGVATPVSNRPALSGRGRRRTAKQYVYKNRTQPLCISRIADMHDVMLSWQESMTSCISAMREKHRLLANSRYEFFVEWSNETDALLSCAQTSVISVSCFRNHSSFILSFDL